MWKQTSPVGGIRLHHHFQDIEKDLRGIKTPILDSEAQLCSKENVFKTHFNALV